MSIWPQFRSPLLWDAMAVGTYGTVSLLFWYVGLIPDLATLRDRTKNRSAQIAYGILAMGWRGSARHWKRYQLCYLLLAGLATPLVVSVHSIVSYDFAVSIVPGWHVTVFPPYFVAGAIFSGFAMVVTIAVPLRAAYGLHDLISDAHLDRMAKIMLVSGLVVAYGYLMEHFVAWYAGHEAEVFMLLNRMFGPYAWSYWALLACNVLIPQVLRFGRARRNVPLLFAVSIVVNVGMWLERYVIVVTSLHRDFLPSSWGMFVPTWVDIMMFVGSFGLFFTFFLLFCKFLPTVAMAEVKNVMPQAHAAPGHEDYHATR